MSLEFCKSYESRILQILWVYESSNSYESMSLKFTRSYESMSLKFTRSYESMSQVIPMSQVIKHWV